MDSLKRGVDVSKWQGKIDWDSVKKSGIDFAMIRAGFGKRSVDPFLDANVKGCEKAGIPYGFYWYSYAVTVTDGVIEAEKCYETIKRYSPSYPVAFDVEDKCYDPLPIQTRTDIVKAFCSTMEQYGYYVLVYASLAWINGKLGDLSRFDLWLAQWAKTATCDKPFGMWQYSSTGRIPGITGYVDLNVAYKDYPAITQKKRPVVTVSNTEIAIEVIKGDWGNGEERKNKLKTTGYDPVVIQELVNTYLDGANNAVKMFLESELPIEGFLEALNTII